MNSSNNPVRRTPAAVTNLPHGSHNVTALQNIVFNLVDSKKHNMTTLQNLIHR